MPKFTHERLNFATFLTPSETCQGSALPGSAPGWRVEHDAVEAARGDSNTSHRKQLLCAGRRGVKGAGRNGLECFGLAWIPDYQNASPEKFLAS